MIKEGKVEEGRLGRGGERGREAIYQEMKDNKESEKPHSTVLKTLLLPLYCMESIFATYCTSKYTISPLL